jgi:CRP/FNR family transcriptional regulator, anaerobic regulatory protein
LLAIISQKLLEEHEHQSFTREVAEQRLISFLLQLSARYAKRGLSPSHFMLPMSRKDIANYLGLTSETVSRLFTRFREQGLIAGRGHEVRLLDMERMAQQVSLCVETKFLDDSNEARLARHEPAVCHPNLLDTRKKATS